MKRRNKSDNPQTPLEVAQPLTPFEIIMSLIFDSSVGMNVPLLLIVVLGFFDLVQIHSRVNHTSGERGLLVHNLTI